MCRPGAAPISATTSCPPSPSRRSSATCRPVIRSSSAKGQLETSRRMRCSASRTGENLFLGMHGWEAPYIPLAIERQPFLIGVNGDELTVACGPGKSAPQCHKRRAGVPAAWRNFRLPGACQLHAAGHSPGAAAGTRLPGGLARAPVARIFRVRHRTGRRPAIPAGRFLHTINEERLAALPGDVLERLNRTGYLQPIYMVLASMSNFRALIERKNRLHAGQC